MQVTINVPESLGIAGIKTTDEGRYIEYTFVDKNGDPVHLNDDKPDAVAFKNLLCRALGALDEGEDDASN